MNKPSVFISYSHKDEAWKDRLVQHLDVLGEEQGFAIWDDRKIGAGADWKAEIEQALKSASVAVLLVSVDFLTSKFIKGEEVPPLLRRREEEGLRIVPVIVGDCAWRHVEWLARMQVRPKDGHEIEGMTKPEGNRALARIAEEIDDLLRLAAKPAATASVLLPTSNTTPADTPRPAALVTPGPPLPPAPRGVVLEPFAFDTATVDGRGTVVEQRTGEESPSSPVVRQEQLAAEEPAESDRTELEVVAHDGTSTLLCEPSIAYPGGWGPSRTTEGIAVRRGVEESTLQWSRLRILRFRSRQEKNDKSTTVWRHVVDATLANGRVIEVELQDDWNMAYMGGGGTGLLYGQTDLGETKIPFTKISVLKILKYAGPITK